MSRYLLDWSSAYLAGSQICGGKGWNLAKLHYYGFVIPEGGVISSVLYRELLEQTDISELVKEICKTPIDELTVQENVLLKNIEQAFLNCKLPHQFCEELDAFMLQHKLQNIPLAVRSSATMEDGEYASFAGIHDSFLNVNTWQDVEYAILKCFASLWTPRALSYRHKLNIPHQQIETALVICELINAQCSGIAFTCDPSGNKRDVSIINANYGLGESVVAGSIEPDQYLVHQFHHKVIESSMGSKKYYTTPQEKGTALAKQTRPNSACLTNEQL